MYFSYVPSIIFSFFNRPLFLNLLFKQILIQYYSILFNRVLSGGHDGWIGVHGISGIPRKQDERSHPSSEDTPLYLEDLPNNDPSAEYEASDSTEAGRGERPRAERNCVR